MEEYKLQDLISIKNGKKYDHLNKGNIPVYGSGGIMTYVDDYLYDGEAVLLPRKGTLNNIMYSKGKLWTVDTMYYALVNEKADPYYLYAYLSQLDLSALDSGSTLPSMTATTYYSIPVKLPNKETQQKIAQVLSTLDRKIALNQQINAELEKMAKTLYDYWFVQFDFPDENGNPYKSSGGEMVYNPELKRDVPKGWEVAQLSEYLDCDRKKLGKNHSFSFINYLDTSNLTNNIIADIQFLNVEKDKIPNRANMVISHNDILFSTVRPNQNHFGLIKKPIKNLIGSTGFAVLTHKENAELNSIFYLCIIRENNLQKLISISESAKSSYPSISKNDILNLFICLPKDINYLEKMAKKFDSIFEKQSTIEKENTQLTQLRDFLLPMLMNGQVEVG